MVPPSGAAPALFTRISTRLKGSTAREIATAIARLQDALAHRLERIRWRMRARPSPKSVLVATAHLLTHRTPFQDRSAEDYEQRAREREVAVLCHKATKPSLIMVEAWL